MHEKMITISCTPQLNFFRNIRAASVEYMQDACSRLMLIAVRDAVPPTGAHEVSNLSKYKVMQTQNIFCAHSLCFTS